MAPNENKTTPGDFQSETRTETTTEYFDDDSISLREELAANLFRDAMDGELSAWGQPDIREIAEKCVEATDIFLSVLNREVETDQ